MGPVLVVRTWSLMLITIVIFVQGNDNCPKPCFCTKVKFGRKVSCTSRGILALNIRSIPDDTVEIILRSNKIHTIQPGAFRRFARLSKLYLEENSLMKIEANTFRGLKKLKHLNISTNQLMYIETSAFAHTSNLRKLSLSNNKLVTLTPEPFINLTIKSLQLDGNPLICDCGLRWLRDWININNIALSANSKCEYPKQLKGVKLSTLLDKDWDCGNHPFEIPQFQLRPFVNQIAFQDDALSLHCSTLWHPTARLVWQKNGVPVPPVQNHTFVTDISDLSGRMNHSILLFNSLKPRDSGDYTCHIDMKGAGKLQRRVQLRVLSNGVKYCELDIQKTHRGAFVWRNTAAGGSSSVPCQFGGIHHRAMATRNCSRDGKWNKLDNARCLHKNKITRNLELLNSYAMNQSNVVQSTRILYSLSKNFTKNLTTVQELQYIIDILNSAAKFGYYSGSLRRNILKILNMLLAMNVQLLRNAQFERQLSTRLLDVIPLTAQSTLDRKGNFNPIITSNIGTHVTSFQPQNYRGLGCIIRFPRGPKRTAIFERGEVYCNVAAKPAKLVEGLDAAVDFSPKLVSATKNKNPLVQRNWVNVTFIAYRASNFFVETVPLTALTKNEDATLSSVIIGLRVQVPGTPRLGMIQSVTIITFRNTKVGKNPRLVFWAKNDKKTGWVHMKSCVLSGTNERFTQFKCSKIPARMLYLAIVMDVEAPAPRLLFKPGISVFIGSGISAAALILAIMIFAGIRDLRYNRNDAAATMNLCLALLVSILIFASGINRVENQMLCKALAVLLHYFLLCALLWLGCGGLCLQTLVVKVKPNDEYNPVLKYYLIGWGLPMIVCGITLAGNSRNYTTDDYCWLYPTASLAAFVGPGALLIIINLGIYIRLHTAINRRFPESGIDSVAATTEVRNRKSRGGSVAAVGDIEDFRFPKKTELLDILRGSLALMLWFCGIVTFAVMMLAYRSRPSSVLFNLFSYGYSIGTIFLGLTILFFFCIRQEAVQLALKGLCWKSKRKKAAELGNREDVLLLSHSPHQGNETTVRPQDQLALLAANAKDQSDVVSGISGPPSIFTDAVSSRPSSIMGPTMPFNFEQNAEKIKELAPVSEREVTENEGRSIHSHTSSRRFNQRILDAKDGALEASVGVDGRAVARADGIVGAPLALADYSTSTLKRNFGPSSFQETPNTTITSLKSDPTFSENGRALSDNNYGETSEQRAEQPGSHKATSSVAGKASHGGLVDLPTNLKSFVPANWKPARRGGSGVSYYPYFDHNFHRLPKKAPSSQGSSGPIPTTTPRAVPIPSRGDVQGGPATTLAVAVHNQIPLLSTHNDPLDGSSVHRGQPVGQSAGAVIATSVGDAVLPIEESNLLRHSNPYTDRTDIRLPEPVLVHTNRHEDRHPSIKEPNANSGAVETFSATGLYPDTSHNAIAVDKGREFSHNLDEDTRPMNEIREPEDEERCRTNTTSDQTELQSPSADTFSPTQSSQQSDARGSRVSSRAADSQMGRRHRKRRRRKRPSSVAFDDIPVPKGIIYIPLPYVEQPVKRKEETSV